MFPTQIVLIFLLFSLDKKLIKILFIITGIVKGNKMIDMQLSNDKLVNRGIHMLCEELSITSSEASTLLDKYGSVRKAIENYK